MEFIFIFISVVLLLINVFGVAIYFDRWLDCFAMSRVAGLISICLFFFFIEHYFGLGAIAWAWPVITVISCTLIFRNRVGIQKYWLAEMIFIFGFIYGLIWRMSFPDINGGSDALSDLFFIKNYLAGHTLPPPDTWLPGYTFNFYPPLQYYSVALMGRLFGWEAGFSFNIGFSLVLAILVSLCWEIAATVCRAKALQVLLLIAVIAGGTGVSIFTHFLFEQESIGGGISLEESSNRLWQSVRFIGNYDAQVNTRFGHELFAGQVGGMDLPMESIGYLTSQGQFNASMGGLVLLMLALLCMYKLEAFHSADPKRQALLVATLPLVMLTHASVILPHLLLLTVWGLHRFLTGKPLYWLAISLGLSVPFALSSPFYMEFSASSAITTMRFINADEHTPARLLLLQFWPQLMLVILAIISPGRRGLIVPISVVCISVFVLSEFVVLDDDLGGKYERFTTTLKWWTWLQVATLLGLGPLLLSSRYLAIRAFSVMSLFCIALYAVDIKNKLVLSPKPSFSKLQGDNWLAGDPAVRELVDYLNVAPKGIVVEGIDEFAYSDSSSVALFSDQQSLLGWPSHQYRWRGNPPFIMNRAQEATLFYRGILKSSASWLRTHNVDYVVWLESDTRRSPEAWEKIDDQIYGDYEWLPFNRADLPQIGVWVSNTGRK